MFGRISAVFAVLIAIVMLFAMSRAEAVTLNQQQCEGLAEWVNGVAEVRDMGAAKGKHWKHLARANPDLAPELLAMLKREFDQVYAQASVPPIVLAQEVYGRCVRNKGDMGTSL